jgi:SLT domain-containing protein/phage-related protein
MAFDAGTIMARLDLDEQSFDRKLKDAQDKKEKFEKDQINLKVGDLFGASQESAARKMFTQLDQQISRDAISRMKSGSGSLLGTLMAITTPGLSGAPSAQQVAKQGLLGKVTSTLTGRGGGGSSGGGDAGILGRIGFNVGGGGGRNGGGIFSNGGPGNKGFGTGLFNGIGPGVLGLGTRAAGIIGGGASLLGALPAVGAIGAGVGVLGAGVGGLIGGSKQLQSQAKTMLDSLKKTFQQAAQPLVAPLEQAFSQIPKFLKSIEPELHDLFAGAAPLMKPLLDGLESLVKGLLPGLVSIIKAGQPAFTVFAQILGMLGRDLGGLFKAFAPAISASSVILKALLGVLGGLLPIIGKLASVFASALAPVFNQFAHVLVSLMPVLTIVGKVFAALATAILGDLVSAFGALAKLLIDISPALKIVATALSDVFQTLENSGVFAVIGDALEAIVPILAKLINTLVAQLAPILPVLITLLTDFANIMIQLLAAGLTTVLTGILLLIKHFPFLVPLLGAATAAFLLFNLALDANPIGVVILAIGLLIGAGTLLVKHWSQIWGAIKQYAEDAWLFISQGFGKYLLPLLGPVGLIALGAIELSQHWHQILHAIESDADSMWQHLVGWGDDIKKLFTATIPGYWDDFTTFTKNDLWNPLRNGVDDIINYIHANLVTPIENIFTNTIPNAFRTAVRMIGTAWSDIKNAVRGPVAWVVDNVIDGLISAFDWISGKVGGPHISQIHPMGLAGGGRIPGYGGGDRHPALLEGGEVVVPKEKAGGLAWLWKMIGIPGYAAGGIIPGGGVLHNIGHAIGDVGKGILSGGKILAALATGNTTALVNAMTGMFPSGVHGAVGDMASLLTDIPKTLVKDAIHSLIGTAKSVSGAKFTGKFGAGVAQWKGDVLKALGMEGLPLSDVGLVLYQMQTESGGNPNAINLTDSNAAAGDPSRGLLQTIMSTFRAFHWPGTSWDIYNPLANIAAALNYAVSTPGVGIGSGHGQLGGGTGYDSGGWLVPGLSVNKTRRPEAVLNPGQSAAFLALAQAASQGRGMGDTSGIEMRLERLIQAVQSSAGRTGGAMADALNGAARKAAYKSAYSARG